MAIETTATGFMNEKRALEKVESLPISECVKIAEKEYGLGTTDPAAIEQIKIPEINFKTSGNIERDK
ncbi:MAG: hypothetical protein NTZ12_00595 [Candidatus Aminicenantes bacterium]|nr:hypothetical protein [Candidatus Aminicenantes bacterium]